MTNNTKSPIWNFFNKTLHYHDNRLSILFDGFIAILILISVSLTPLFFFDYFKSIEKIAHHVDFFIVCIFLIEYLLRLWSSKKRLAYIFSFSGIIDLIAIGPAILQYFGIIPSIFQVIIFIRFIRIIKLFFIYKNERDDTIKKIDNLSSHGDFEKGDNEIMLGIIHKHAIVFFLSLFPIFILTTIAVFTLAFFKLHLLSILGALFFITIASIIFTKNWIDFHYDVIYITDKRVVIQDSHIFGSDIQTIPLSAIKEIHPKTYGLTNWILDSGSLEIDTGATEEAIVFDNVSSMKKMKKILLKAHINQSQKSSS